MFYFENPHKSIYKTANEIVNCLFGKRRIFIDKIIFNDPCVILIDSVGDKTIVRTQGKEKFDTLFGYYLVLCKYLSDNETYSELLAHIYDERTKNKQINVMESFLMGALGVKVCRKIDGYKVLSNIDPSNNENNKNHTVNFQEVLND